MVTFFCSKHIRSRFEPHGSGTKSYNYNSANNDLTEFFKLKSVIDKIGVWIYKSSNEFCPIGPQTKAGKHYYEKKMGKVFGRDAVIESGGFCAAWSLLFVHYRLANPKLTDNQIVKYMNSFSSEELSNKIREYAAFIVNSVDKNWVNSKNRKVLEIGDYVNLYNGRSYGVIVKKNPKNALVLTSKYNKERPFKSVYSVGYGNIIMMEDSSKISDIEKVRNFILNNPRSTPKLTKTVKVKV